MGGQHECRVSSLNPTYALKIPPGNRLEVLSGDRIGEFSIRINEQYRVCFKWGESGPYDVEVTDYH